MSDFDFDIQDDLQVSEEAYQDREFKGRPPLPGNYRVSFASKFDYRKNKAGEIVLWKNRNGDPTYPVVNLQMVEIMEPLEFGRKVAVFQDVPTAPFQREEKLVSEIGDLMRAIDANASISGTGAVLQRVQDAFNANEQILVRLDYKAYDKTAAADAVAKVDKNDRKAVNKAYRSAEVKGFKRIKQDNIKRGKPNLPITQWVGPSGNIVDVQPYISIYYPSNETVTLGPDKAAVNAQQ